MLQKLPIGEQSFQKIRENKMLYVDKTEQIHRLLTGASYSFLSRPRRFGKSLTLSTIHEIFNGNKSLFEGLWIENHWDWSLANPVIHISFSTIGYNEIGLLQALTKVVSVNAAKFEIVLEATTPGMMLKELIFKLNAKSGAVVLLIDEYDKPLIDFLEKNDLHIAKENQKILKTFYSGLKDKESQEALRFFMITGVSKFSQVSIFSDLNYLDDITIGEQFADLVGYTHNELEVCFVDWFEHLQKKHTDLSAEELKEQIKMWYNGYTWDGETKVFNPFSILQLFNKREFQDYWFKTGTPTFLMKVMREKRFFNLNNLKVNKILFDSYDLDNLDIRSLLFQTGYLTIKSIDKRRGQYTLDYPNREVEEAMHDYLIGLLLHTMPADSTRPILQLEDAFVQNDPAKVVQIINTMLKDLPSHVVNGKDEHFYHSLVHLHFRYLGLYINSEVHTSDGRMDAVVQTDTHIYILEFKLDESAKIALQQIHDKKYADKYALENKTIVCIGINFNSEKKSVDDWEVE
jgi:Predicted AAA-ATPase/PD-(D/E)XK nuclease superfamily